MNNINGNSQSAVQAEPPPQLTDTGNAIFFANIHGQDVRHCHTSRKWIIWDGSIWAEDKTGEIYRKAKDAAVKVLVMTSNLDDDYERRKSAKHALGTESEARLLGGEEWR